MTETATAAEQRRRLVGEVASNKMTKTIVVKVSRRIRHPRYHKVLTVIKRFYAHDEQGQARVGDTVRIVASRPLSRLKHWQLEAVLAHARLAEKVES
ncbi:30S ribosomal protein S17 [bacterium]|nr:30S ribosomal protein S17 [bacterium]